MEKERILIVGLEEKDVNIIKNNINSLVIAYDMLPKIKLIEGILYVESQLHPDKYLKIDKVIFHGIFENDFDFITLLALWGGKCLPDATGMMDCRLRHSGLVRALKVTKFGNMPRGMSIKSEIWQSPQEIVAKWGNWHCGENKYRFKGDWQTAETTVFEPFIVGNSVRIMKIGNKYWQIQLEGEDWLKSIHHSKAKEMPMDMELLEDTKNIAQHFNLLMLGVDYIIDENNHKYLLEVNHIPNVTVFEFMNEYFIEFAIQWCKEI